MKKHLWTGLATALLMLCSAQPSAAAEFNPRVHAAASNVDSSAANTLGYGDRKYNVEAHTPLGELKIILAALQHDVAAMKSDTQGVAAYIARVKTVLDRVETQVNPAPPRNNVWVRGPRRSGP